MTAKKPPKARQIWLLCNGDLVVVLSEGKGYFGRCLYYLTVYSSGDSESYGERLVHHTKLSGGGGGGEGGKIVSRWEVRTGDILFQTSPGYWTLYQVVLETWYRVTVMAIVSSRNDPFWNFGFKKDVDRHNLNTSLGWHKVGD